VSRGVRRAHPLQFTTQSVRICYRVTVNLKVLPSDFHVFADAAVAAIRRTYDINAGRYDPSVGDDAVVFGIAVYRNSWFLIEEEVALLDGWSSARPAGSLVAVGAGLRVHVYRCGYDADVDLDSFRLDDARSSVTQRLIAAANSVQLRLDLGDLDEFLAASTQPPLTGADELRELVIVHAGNPDDGCCGVWVGTPVATDEITVSPWAWIQPLWSPGGGLMLPAPEPTDDPRPPRHDELPEPELTLRPVAAKGRSSQAES
jgi:hypothetical protein